MNYFSDCKTLTDVKTKHRSLAAKHHPDRGGSVDVMKEINRQYEQAVDECVSAMPDSEFGDKYFWQSREEISEIFKKMAVVIDQLMELNGLELEVTGCWIWVTGNTKPHKERLKELGLRWCKNKTAWVWQGKKSYSRGNISIDEIRQKYGSSTFFTTPQISKAS